MSDLITFEVKGLKEMGDQLGQLPVKIARHALGQAVKAGAMVIRDAARPRAPLGTRAHKDWRGKMHRPGTLRRTGVLLKKLRTSNWQTTQLYGIGFSKIGFYGKWIERGKAKKHHYDPHPFIVPTMEENAEKAIAAIKRELGIQLWEIGGKIPGVIVK